MSRTALAVACVMVFSLFAMGGNPSGVRKGGTSGINSGTSCATSNSLPSIGLPTGDFINSNSVGYYWSVVMTGHSYSAEVVDTVDLYHGAFVTLGLVQSDCVTVVPFTDIVNDDPDLGETTSDRISWISSSSAPVVVTLTNTDTTNGYSYHVSLTDTTLHNPRWSTYNSYVTQYGFLNNTSGSITGTLTVTESTGTPHTLSVTIPAGAMVLRTVGPSGDVVMPGNRFGSAMFAFVGPPGAITADAYFVGPNASVVVPAVFAPRNFQH